MNGSVTRDDLSMLYSQVSGVSDASASCSASVLPGAGAGGGPVAGASHDGPLGTSLGLGDQVLKQDLVLFYSYLVSICPSIVIV